MVPPCSTFSTIREYFPLPQAPALRSEWEPYGKASNTPAQAASIADDTTMAVHAMRDSLADHREGRAFATEQMQRLNSAFDEIQQRIDWVQRRAIAAPRAAGPR